MVLFIVHKTHTSALNESSTRKTERMPIVRLKERGGQGGEQAVGGLLETPGMIQVKWVGPKAALELQMRSTLKADESLKYAKD